MSIHVSDRLEIGVKCFVAVNTWISRIGRSGERGSKSKDAFSCPTFFYPRTGSMANGVDGLTGFNMSLTLRLLLHE